MSNYDNETTYDIVCPFCFKRFTYHRALFADYKQLSEAVPEEYAGYMKTFLGIEEFSARKMPTFFRKEGGTGAEGPFAAVTASGDIAYARACPFCCNIIPAASGRVKSFSVAVIGSEDGERGYYIASVLHKLNREMSARFGASFIPADFNTAQMFYDRYEEPLYVDKTVPEAMTSVSPLVFEYCRRGAVQPEEWVGSKVTYNRALIYIYNIDKELCDRYPMIADAALTQAGGIVFLSDISGIAGMDEPTNDPWLGHLTGTFRKLFGLDTVDKPSAVVLTNADRAARADRKLQTVLKNAGAKRIEKTFPVSYYAKLSAKTEKILQARLPAYYSVLSAVFDGGNTGYFPANTFYELQEDGRADIRDSRACFTSFDWLLAKLGVLPDDSARSFRVKK